MITRSLLLVMLTCVSLYAADRPNLIYILADDLGYGDLGCYGQKTLKTPNLDRMAREGVLFENCFVNGPVCVPSRKSVFSGLAVVPPGETREITLAYDLPPGALADEDGSLIYELIVQKQPGVKTRKTSVTLVPPMGYHVSASSSPYVVKESGWVSISLALMRDETIKVTFVED